MELSSYFSEVDGQIGFSRKQGSDFAKTVADDFNPLHNEDAKRFVVPGDLLFAIALQRYGLSHSMQFEFSSMVGDSTQLRFPEPSAEIEVCDDKGKTCLRIQRSGAGDNDGSRIDSLTRAYVGFSGKTFPHILVPLMAEAGVMINPARPMVMYESMAIELEDFEFDALNLQLNRDRTALEIDGKRGTVKLCFDFLDGQRRVGGGEKHMLLSGLREYDQQAIDAIVDEYNQWKQSYQTG